MLTSAAGYAITEHKGANNRMLRELGWIEVKGNRDSPRNSEVSLRPDDGLLALRKELLSSRKNPDRFISLIFHSSDKVWVDRCSSIITEE